MSEGGEITCPLAAPDEVLLSILKAAADCLCMARAERNGNALPHKALGFVADQRQGVRILELAKKHKVCSTFAFGTRQHSSDSH